MLLFDNYKLIYYEEGDECYNYMYIIKFLKVVI